MWRSCYPCSVYTQLLETATLNTDNDITLDTHDTTSSPVRLHCDTDSAQCSDDFFDFTNADTSSQKHVQCESKNPSLRGPDIFFHFFHKPLRIFNPFLPARRYASAGNRIATCPSVCLSVCPSRAGIVSKRRKLLYHLVARPKTLVLWHQISSPNSKEFPPNGGLKEGSVGKNQRFSSFKRLSRKR